MSQSNTLIDSLTRFRDRYFADSNENLQARVAEKVESQITSKENEQELAELVEEVGVSE